MSKQRLFWDVQNGCNSGVQQYAAMHRYFFEINVPPRTLSNRHCNHQHFTYKHYEKKVESNETSMRHQWYIHETSTKHPWIINKTSQLQLHPFLLGSKVPSAREVGFLRRLHTGLPGALRVSTGRSSTAGQTQQAIVTWGEAWWVTPTNPWVKAYSKWSTIGVWRLGKPTI